MYIATMLNNKLDFYCCDNLIGFYKSSHIISYNTDARALPDTYTLGHCAYIPGEALTAVS